MLAARPAQHASALRLGSLPRALRRRRAARRPAVQPAHAAASASAEQQAQPQARRRPIHFSELPLDRAAHLRDDPARLDSMLASPDALCLLAHHGRLLCAPPGAAAAQPDPEGARSSSVDSRLPRVATHSFGGGRPAPSGEPAGWAPLVAQPAAVAAAATGADRPRRWRLDGSAGFLFLGLEPAGRPVFACQLSGPDPAARLAPEVVLPGAALPAGSAWVEARRGGQAMSGGDAALCALAAGLLAWHRAAAFSGASGARLASASGGFARAEVPDAGAAPAPHPDAAEATKSGGGSRPVVEYPRIDPAVIVAVGCCGWLLLGRKAAWDPGRYSLLAGFAEVGETLEQAAAREVLEESGVVVDGAAAAYHSSQPWPFPRSLMLGFTVEAPEATGPPPPSGKAEGPEAGAGGARGQRGPAPRGLGRLGGEGRRCALGAGLRAEEAEAVLAPRLQTVQVAEQELQDARWFHADYLAAALGLPAAHPRALHPAGSGRYPEQGAGGFRIPGPHALAHSIISDWLAARLAARDGPHSGAAQQGGDPPGSAHSSALRALPPVAVGAGVFKYVLIRARDPRTGDSTLLVRGDPRAPYHNDVLQAAVAEARGADPALQLDVLGGGRMEHQPGAQALSVYGYSAAFGPAPHEVTAALLRRWLPFHEITVSYGGY